MPPKRKTKRKPPKRSKSQSQSQRQSVTINLNKTTPAKKKKRSGRGGLPPPSHQQNLFPPTIIQQQAPNIAVLENQISRLTSMIQEPTGIKQPTTPLSADTGAKNAEAQRLAGEQAEERRAGPTAGNFQAPPSVASTDSQSLANIPPNPAFNLETAFGNLRPADEYYTEQLVSDTKPPNMGEGGGGESLTEKQRKNRERAKKQAEEKAEIKRKLDRGEDLTDREKKVAESRSGQIGIKRAEETGFFVP